MLSRNRKKSVLITINASKSALMAINASKSALMAIKGDHVKQKKARARKGADQKGKKPFFFGGVALGENQKPFETFLWSCFFSACLVGSPAASQNPANLMLSGTISTWNKGPDHPRKRVDQAAPTKRSRPDPFLGDGLLGDFQKGILQLFSGHAFAQPACSGRQPQVWIFF